MSDDYTDLVSRLRATVWTQVSEDAITALEAQAARITELEAEVAERRGFACRCGHWSMDHARISINGRKARYLCDRCECDDLAALGGGS